MTDREKILSLLLGALVLFNIIMISMTWGYMESRKLYMNIPQECIKWEQFKDKQ